MTDTAVPADATEFTLWAVFHRNPQWNVPCNSDDVADLDDTLREVSEDGVHVRGLYDVSGLRSDADLMVWLHGPSAAALQASLRTIRRTAVFRRLLPTWNAMGVHRTAEFNSRHVPAYMRGAEPKRWLTLYPFVRSYDWYLLPDEDRSRMLAEHGQRGGAYREVLTNTVAAFALGDYEWLLGLEADDLPDLVDMMRDLRYTQARRHVREEVPFFTGRRIQPIEVPEVLQ